MKMIVDRLDGISITFRLCLRVCWIKQQVLARTWEKQN